MSKPKIAVDVIMLVVYLLAATPALTGIPLHEYMGLGAFIVMVAHTAMSADRLFAKKSPLRALLNLALIITLALTVVSGIMVSGAVLPALGLYATGYFFWNPLHAVAAKLLLAVVLVHVVLRGPALWAVVKRVLSRQEQPASDNLEGCELGYEDALDTGA